MSKILIKCFGLKISIEINDERLILKPRGKMVEYDSWQSGKEFRNAVVKVSRIELLFNRTDTNSESLTGSLEKYAAHLHKRAKEEHFWDNGQTTEIENLNGVVCFKDAFNDGLNNIYSVWLFKPISEDVFLCLLYSSEGKSDDEIFNLANLLINSIKIE